ncbi:hypothetical protein Patl1_22758 [Pistacia atlantica]|uniref:Uncharacterized protein n=1 Tax=Pistacia atlantica TaxID=434234 RepID=A0ACC0ZUZ8_9ROSI|nr:hypothetical protein Patl1_22758 [Pistacia atlantica]
MSNRLSFKNLHICLEAQEAIQGSVFNVPEHYRWSISSYLYKDQNALPWTHGSTMTIRSTMGALKVSMLSPGFIYEPYAPREAMPFWRRWFTRNGWRRTKEDMILEVTSLRADCNLL